MVSSRTRTTTQRGVAKVKTARVVVMMMLILVAVTIVLIDKKENVPHEDAVPNNDVKLATAVSTEQNIIGRPTSEIFSNPSIARDVVSSTQNAFKPVEINKPTVVENKIQEEIISPVKEIVKPKLSEPQENVVSKEKSAVEKFVANLDKGNRKSDSDKVVAKEKKKLSKNNALIFHSDEKFHVVQKGETLSKISEKHYGSQKLWLALLQANHDILSSAKDLKPGQKIRIPPSEELQKLVAQNRRLSPKSPSHGYNFESTISGKAKPSVEKSSQKYCVLEGDTLASIAKKTGVSFLKLYDLNEHIQKNPNKLLKGTIIQLPCASPNH